MGCEGCIPAGGADAEDTDCVGVEVLAADKKGYAGLDVFDSLVGILEVSRPGFGLALICGVLGEADEADLGEDARIVGWRVLLDGGLGVAYYYSSARAIMRAGDRMIDVGSDSQVASE